MCAYTLYTLINSCIYNYIYTIIPVHNVAPIMYCIRIVHDTDDVIALCTAITDTRVS